MFQNIDELTDHGNKEARRKLLDIAETATQRVHPRRTVPTAIKRDGSKLRVADRVFDLTKVEDIYVIGAGKGSVAVVEELERILSNFATDGIVAEKVGQARPIDIVDVVGAGHPIPDQTSITAGQRALEIIDEAGENDLVFACITGGASAQLVAPAGPLSLEDIRSTTNALLNTGLPIDEINTVRKHLSKLKGGRFTQLAAPSTVVSLIIIDEVAGEPWGPTVPDETSFRDALNVLEHHNVIQAIPESVHTYLQRGMNEPRLETPNESSLSHIDTTEVVLAGPVEACEAARDRVLELGYDPLILSTSIEGESKEVATALAGIVREVRTHDRPIERPCVLITGGETTVNVTGDGGEGGPNQEFALQFAMEIPEVLDVTAIALGTDGTDGPTDIAGGLVDGTTFPQISSRDISPFNHLERNNAAIPLKSVHDAVYTGPTGTNVMDLRLIFVDQ